MGKSNNDFKFYCGVEIRKAKDDDGNEIMRLGGIASTIDKDSDDEFLDPNGFEIEEFLKTGLINWHHQAKNSPITIIGEPYMAEIRPDGFYVETDLYPSSKMAQEVYETACILSKDSKTRRLGYSIEGKVLERGSDDEKDPEYNQVKRARITGLAITHMPKNPKTFADIIKGHIEDEEEEEFEKEEEKTEDSEEKSLDTTSGAPLVKESVDSSYRVKESDPVKRKETIIKSFSGITVEKADKINNLFTKIEEKMKAKVVTDADIEKAMDVLGLEVDQNPFIEKAKPAKKKKETPEEIGAAVTKQMFGKGEEDEEDDEDEDEDDSDEEEEEEEKPAKKSIKKGVENDLGDEKTSNRILKAIEGISDKQSTTTRALATLVKAQMDSMDILKGQVSSLIADGTETKAELQKANEMIEELSGQPVARRSITKAGNVVEKGFDQSGGLIEKGNQRTANQLSMSRDYKQVLNLLDNASMEKGTLDGELSKAVMSFEASRNLPANIIQRMKLEKGIEIVN